MSYLSGAVVNRDRDAIESNRLDVKMNRALGAIILRGLGPSLADALPETGNRTTKQIPCVSVCRGESIVVVPVSSEVDFLANVGC